MNPPLPVINAYSLDRYILDFYKKQIKIFNTNLNIYMKSKIKWFNQFSLLQMT